MSGHDCLNCGTRLHGPWCHTCGQKQIAPEDRTLKALLGELFSALTDVDGRVIRSFHWLLFRPGRLAHDYLHGIRARHLSPVSLFLAVNVLYFFAPSLSDFNLPLHDHLHGHFHSAFANMLVDARLAERNTDLDTYEDIFHAEENNLAKLLILFHVPLLAAGLCLLHYRCRRPAADHVLVAFWFMAFALLHLQLTPLLLLACAWLVQATRFSQWLLNIVLLAPLLAWTFFLLKGAYAQGNRLAAIKTPLVIGVALGSHLVYRAILFLVTFART